MIRPQNYKWRVYIGSWSLTQWLKYLILIVAVIVAANYIGGGSQRSKVLPGNGVLADNPGQLGDDQQFIGAVVDVVDGDTLDVVRNGSRVRIRLSGIDCPELKQSFGEEAKRFAADAVLTKQVIVKPHGKDKYGRTLGDVVFDDSRMLNRELLKAGLAWWYRKYSNDTDLAELEQQARSNRIGLWVELSPIPPWEFRAAH